MEKQVKFWNTRECDARIDGVIKEMKPYIGDTGMKIYINSSKWVLF